MDTNHQNLIAQLLDAAQTAGADGADAMLAGGESNRIEGVDANLGEATYTIEEFSGYLGFL